jgi:hypothetical protein
MDVGRDPGDAFLTGNTIEHTFGQPSPKIAYDLQKVQVMVGVSDNDIHGTSFGTRVQ